VRSKIIFLLVAVVMLIAVPVNAAGVQASNDIVEKVSNRYLANNIDHSELDLMKAQKLPTSNGQVRVIIPVVDPDYDEFSNASFLVADTKNNNIIALEKMHIKKEVNNETVETAITFSEIDGSNAKTGIFFNGELSDVLINGESVFVNDTISAAASDQGVVECIIAAFESMPFFLQAACTGVCAGVFTGNPIFLAACAGCIFASGTDNHCF